MDDGARCGCVAVWQKGPGEGYHAAKADALRICPTLRCHRVMFQDGRRVAGYFVEDGRGSEFTSAVLARDAWNNAFFALGGRFEGSKAIIPKLTIASKRARHGARRKIRHRRA